MSARSLTTVFVTAAAMLIGVAPAAAAGGRAAQLEDIRFARTAYVRESGSFSAGARQQAERLLERMEAQAGELTPVRFMVEMARVAALSDNAHDRVLAAQKAWRPAKMAPFRLVWLQDTLVIARVAPEQADLAGAKILEIEGRSPEQLFRHLRALQGGNDVFRRTNVTWAIEWGEVLHSMSLAQHPDRLRMKVRKPDGAIIDRTIAFVRRESLPQRISAPRLLAPQRTQDEARLGWQAWQPVSGVPLYLAEPDKAFRMQVLRTADLLYIQYRSNMSEGSDDVDAFSTEVRKALPMAAGGIVMDMRHNVGGDIEKTRGLLHDIVAGTQGPIFLLVGPHTFSAGIVAAAALKHDGGKRVSILGDGIGDRLRFWAEAEHLLLPNSQLYLHPSKGLWDLARGCAGEARCYGDQFNATVGALTIDKKSPISYRDWLAGRDPGLAAIEKLTRRSKLVSAR